MVGLSLNHMNGIDYFFIIFISVIAYRGFSVGLIRSFGKVISIIFSTYLAVRYYVPVADAVIDYFGWSANYRIFIFILAFLLIHRVVVIIAWAVFKSLNIIDGVPVLTPVNRLAGLMFGLLEGLLIISVLVYLIERYPLWGYLMDLLTRSGLAPILSEFAGFIWPMWPEAVKLLDSSVIYAESFFLK